MTDLIIAADDNNGIGYQSRLPWGHSALDMQWYRKVCGDRPRITSWETYQTLPLRARQRGHHVIVSRTAPMAVTLAQAIKDHSDGVIIGGAGIFHAAMSDALPERVYFTRIRGLYKADTHIRDICEYDGYLLREQLSAGNCVFEIWQRRDLSASQSIIIPALLAA